MRYGSGNEEIWWRKVEDVEMGGKKFKELDDFKYLGVGGR